MTKGAAVSSRRHQVTNELAGRAGTSDVASPGVEIIAVASNNSMQRTALRAAADAERYQNSEWPLYRPQARRPAATAVPVLLAVLTLRRAHNAAVGAGSSAPAGACAQTADGPGVRHYGRRPGTRGPSSLSSGPRPHRCLWRFPGWWDRSRPGAPRGGSGAENPGQSSGVRSAPGSSGRGVPSSSMTVQAGSCVCALRASVSVSRSRKTGEL
jgi:hypothetical protein